MNIKGVEPNVCIRVYSVYYPLDCLFEDLRLSTVAMNHELNIISCSESLELRILVRGDFDSGKTILFLQNFAETTSRKLAALKSGLLRALDSQ